MRRIDGGYILRRLVQAVGVLWAAYTVSYLILNVLPSDPLALMLKARGTDVSSLSASQLSTLRRSYGLDEGPLSRYFTMLVRALRGDFGDSYTYGVPVTHLLVVRVSSTLLISLLSILLAVLIAFVIAVASVSIQSNALRRIISSLPVLGASVPSFWVGLLLMQVFSFGLGWFPSMGMKGWRSLVLPTVTMSIPTSALLAQLLVSEFERVMSEPYVIVAKAHGLGRGKIIVSHVIKNASLPALTILGLILGDTVTGAIVAETVFSRQGIGMLVQQAVTNQDIPVVQATVALAAAAFVLVNLIVDLLYPLLDPRIDGSGRRHS